MTTIPSRIAKIEKTLDSLCRQTVPPDAIYLNLPLRSPKARPYKLPSFLERYKPLLQVVRCQRDYGPITKLVPTLDVEQDPQTLIVVVDDDHSYPPDMLENFQKAADKYPNCAVGYSGWIVGRLQDYMGLVQCSEKGLPFPVQVDYLEGNYGMAYRRCFFDRSMLDYADAPQPAALRMDDVWIGGHLDARGVKRLVIAGRPPRKMRTARIEAICGQRLKFVMDHTRLVRWFRQRGLFNARQVASPKHAIGYYGMVLALILFGALIAVLCFLGHHQIDK